MNLSVIGIIGGLSAMTDDAIALLHLFISPLIPPFG